MGVVTEDRFRADGEQLELNHNACRNQRKNGGEEGCALALGAHTVTSTPVANSWSPRLSRTILGRTRVDGPAVGRPALSSNTPGRRSTLCGACISVEQSALSPSARPFAGGLSTTSRWVSHPPQIVVAVCGYSLHMSFHGLGSFPRNHSCVCEWCMHRVDGAL